MKKLELIPILFYGITKYNGEILVKQILGSTKTQTTIFRLFNTYGPGEDLNNLKKEWLVFTVATFGKKNQL